MGYQLTPFALVNITIFLLTMSLAGYGVLRYIWRSRREVLLAFLTLLGSIALAQFIDALISGLTSPGAKLALINLTNAALVPLFTYSLLWFTLVYTNSPRWTIRAVGIVAVVNVVVLSVALTLAPEFFYIVDGVAYRGPVTVLGLTFQQWPVLNRTLKLPFQLFLLTQYLFLLAAGVVLARYTVRNRSAVPVGQAVALGVGIGTPVIVNGSLVAGIMPPELNLTDVAVGVTALAFAVAVFRYRMLDFAPVGRQQVVETMADPVVMIDDDGRVVDSNPAARNLVDAPSAWRGMSAAAFFSPFPDQFDRFRDVDSVDTTISVDTNGTTRYFDLEITTIRNGPDGGQFITLREVTPLKRREEQLQRQNQRLEQFASVVSHDLRNPLNVVQIRLEGIREDLDAEHWDPIDRNLGRMESMIEDLLTLARAGQTVEATNVVSLANVANEAWVHTEGRDCELEIALSDTLTVQADRDRLLQVFENLFRNAVDHNEPPLTIRVGSLNQHEPAEDGRQRTGFFVADDGNGIPVPDRDEIFEHGYTTSTDGTGLGLSIVQDIVDAHDWDLRVTAETDGGARFEITGVEIDR